VSPRIERIFVILDAAGETAAAIAAAVRFAARSKTPLHAVFVEEEDLLKVAELPVARHIVPGSGNTRLTSAEVELHWRAAAIRAREDLVAAAEGQALEYSFRIVRGAAETVLASASESDLIIAGARTRPVAGHFRVHSRWLIALETVPGPFLLAQAGLGAKGEVVVLLHERRPASARLLQVAAHFAELSGAPLTIIAAPALAAEKELSDWIRQQLPPALPQPQIEAAPADTAALNRRISELDCRVLAIDAATTERDRIVEISERFACDILMAR
jgi:hypothetical protein